MTFTALPTLHTRWLTEDVSDSAAIVFHATNDYQHGDLEIDPAIGRGWFERMPLTDGLSVLHAVHSFRQDVPCQLVALGDFKCEFPETAFAVQTVHGGTVFHREFLPPAELIFKRGYDLFRYAKGFHTTPSIDT